MLAECRAATDFDGSREHSLDTQILETERGGDDVDNRIRRADFVKVHFLHIDAVNIGFRFSQGSEHRDCALFYGATVTGAFDDFDDLCETPMRFGRILAQDDGGPGAFDTHLGCRLDFEFEFGFEGEFCELAPQVVHRYADVYHRAYVHVAGNSAETVVQKRPCHGPMLTQGRAGSPVRLDFTFRQDSLARSDNRRAASKPPALLRRALMLAAAINSTDRG